MMCGRLIYPSAPDGPRCVSLSGHAGACAWLACANPGCTSYDGHGGTCAPNESGLAIELRLILAAWDRGDLAHHELRTRLKLALVMSNG